MKNKLAKQIADNGDERRWGTLEDIERIFGFSRSTTYYLISENKIKSRLIRFAGSKGTGRRLVSLRSIDAWLESQPVATTKNISRRMRDAALRSAAVRSAKGAVRR